MEKVIDGSEKEIIDLVSGSIYYSGSDQATLDNLLRPIENSLNLSIKWTIQKRDHWPKEYAWLLQTMPDPVPELINFLYQERALPLGPDDAKILAESYRLGEHYFKLGRSFFGSTQKPVTISLTSEDAEKLREAYTQTHKILTRLLADSRG